MARDGTLMASARGRGAAGPPADVVAGIAAWAVTFALSTGPLEDRIGLLEGLWLLGPLAVVPLGLALLAPPVEVAPGLDLVRRAALPAAAFVVASALAGPGVLSASLAMPWLVVASLTCGLGFRWFSVAPSARAKVIVPVAGLVFLALASACLVAWRGQARPFGLSDAAVALAAVHLTFVGFGLAVVADRTREAATRRPTRTVAGGAGIALIVAVAILVAGSVADSTLVDLVGSVVLAAASLVVTGVMLGYALRKGRAPGATALLVVSAGSVLFTLVLAVQFAIGQWSDDYTLSVTRMLELHGTVGGLGVVVGGLLGWTFADLPTGQMREPARAVSAR